MFGFLLKLVQQVLREPDAPTALASHRLAKLLPVEIEINGLATVIDFNDTGRITVVHRDGVESDVVSRVQRFVDYLAMTASAYGLLNVRFGPEINHDRRCRELNHAFAAWEAMNGEVDANGNLKKSMICIAYRESPPNDWFRCAQSTKSKDGLCRHHRHPGVRTIFNFDMLSKSDRIWRSVELAD